MFEKAFFLIVLAALIIALSWLDKKYQLGLNGCVRKNSDNNNRLANENSELKRRIEVLERIVTEPAYELNQQLAKLK